MYTKEILNLHVQLGVLEIIYKDFKWKRSYMYIAFK